MYVDISINTSENTPLLLYPAFAFNQSLNQSLKTDSMLSRNLGFKIKYQNIKLNIPSSGLPGM